MFVCGVGWVGVNVFECGCIGLVHMGLVYKKHTHASTHAHPKQAVEAMKNLTAPSPITHTTASSSLAPQEGLSTLEKLSELTATPTSQLKFVFDAWQQVIECRRIIKWTYAYGFYKFDAEADESVKSQQEFFEFNQV